MAVAFAVAMAAAGPDCTAAGPYSVLKRAVEAATETVAGPSGRRAQDRPERVELPLGRRGWRAEPVEATRFADALASPALDAEIEAAAAALQLAEGFRPADVARAVRRALAPVVADAKREAAARGGDAEAAVRRAVAAHFAGEAEQAAPRYVFDPTNGRLTIRRSFRLGEVEIVGGSLNLYAVGGALCAAIFCGEASCFAFEGPIDARLGEALARAAESLAAPNPPPGPPAAE